MDDFKSSKMDVLIAGVGGQGVVLAGDIIAELALASGYDVKKSDTIGMAQRGGSVVAQIRLGPRIASPTISRGEADYLLAFEKLEAARWADYLKKGAIIIYNDYAIPPLSVNRGEMTYPDDEQIIMELSRYSTDIFKLSANSLATEIGSVKILNTVMLGALSMFLPFSPENWKRVLADRIPGKLQSINLDAFAAGRKQIMKTMTELADEQDRLAFEEANHHKHDDACGCG
jgi:indolepyruvate ferredoxin oxidoreductase beta subunit